MQAQGLHSKAGSERRERTHSPAHTPAGVVRWVSHAIRAFMKTSAVTAGLVIVSLIVFGWAAIYFAGGTRYIPSHWFYIPILFAAIRFGLKGATVTAVICGIVAGPLLPTEVALGVHQSTSVELYRAGYFVLMGVLLAAIIVRLEDSLVKETELAKHAAEVSRHEAQLAAQQAALVSTVSHEFRSPLSVLIATSKMLAGEGTGVDPAIVDGMSTAARRLNDLVTAVLAMSEGPLTADHEVRDIPVREVVLSVRDGLELPVRNRVKIDLTDSVIRTSPAVLEGVLRQLVDNGLKFSSDGSPVAIDVEGRPEDGLRFVVSDRGPGIDATFLPRAFEAFTQQDESMTRSFGGLGIGLYVAQRLAGHLDATLELSARTGGGTKAIVTLPAQSAQPRP